MTIARRVDYQRRRRHGTATITNQVVFQVPEDSETLTTLLTVDRGFHLSLANEETADAPDVQAVKQYPDQLLWVEAKAVSSSDVIEARELYAVWSQALWKVARRVLFQAAPAHWEMLLVWQRAEIPTESQ